MVIYVVDFKERKPAGGAVSSIKRDEGVNDRSDLKTDGSSEDMNIFLNKVESGGEVKWRLEKGREIFGSGGESRLMNE
jgi:hypothetical protein